MLSRELRSFRHVTRSSRASRAIAASWIRRDRGEEGGREGGKEGGRGGGREGGREEGGREGGRREGGVNACEY